MLIHPLINKQICKLEVEHLKPEEWFTLFRVLRQKSLVASFYVRLVRAHKDQLIPEELGNAFISANRFSTAQTHQVNIQLKKLHRLFSSAEINFVMLKGAAYVAAGTPNSAGRLMSDIDICVQQRDLAKVEDVLKTASWQVKTLDDHDEKYYREWSHELPPYKHPFDGVSLDIHHTIFPPVANKTIAITDLFKSAQNSNAGPKCPSSEWLVFHSAVHLLANEDVENGLRDLIDIYLLITSEEVGINLSQLRALFERSQFKTEFFLLIQLLNDYFDYNCPDTVVSKEERLGVFYYIRLWSLRRAIYPDSPFIKGSGYRLARILNYVIGYSQKMPLLLLFRHLTFKSSRNLVKLVFGNFYFRKSSG